MYLDLFIFIFIFIYVNSFLKIDNVVICDNKYLIKKIFMDGINKYKKYLRFFI